MLNGTPLPPTVEKVIALIELIGDCEAFGIDPCSDETNFTPLFDNITVRVTDALMGPTIQFDYNCEFQDVGSFPSNLFDPRAPGPANNADDKNMTTPPGSATDLAGDSLVIAGPQPSPSDPNSHWGARLWWRVAKRALFTTDTEGGLPSRYSIWRTRVADDVLGDPNLLDRPDHPLFTFGWMDTVQMGFVLARNKFCSYFREDDDDFRGENFDGSNPETEMIWDDVLLPGTQIDYFITSAYASTPNELFFLPDTSGGYFYEFEILPGLRTAHVPDCGDPGFDYCAFQPAMLYIDAYNRGAQRFIEQALLQVLHDQPLRADLDRLGSPIPRDRHWDRYDYLSSSGCGGMPFMRGTVAGSNNGMTLNQLLGYRTILLSTGTMGEGNMEDQDFLLFSEWLTSAECNDNTHRQVFLANGDRVGSNIEQPGGNDIDWHGLAFMNDKMGASLYCDSFNGNTNDDDCGEESSSYCVQLADAEGCVYSSEFEIDAYGNSCPNLYGFNVCAPVNGGIGNRTYVAEDGLKEMAYTQITHEDLGADANYRTILTSPSYHHMTARNGAGSGMDRCPRDPESIVGAAAAEIGSALRWGFDVEDNEPIPKLVDALELADCQGTGEFPAGAGETGSLLVNRLFPIQPNPFNPTATIRFNLARDGWVDVSIYDVQGRQVRTLMDGKRKAGLHTVTWNGRNDANTRVGSGIYWVQMKTGVYISNKKMVLLK